MNQFENHDLVVNIYNTLRDHGVLKNDAPFQTLTTEETRFLEEIDRDISDANALKEMAEGAKDRGQK